MPIIGSSGSQAGTGYTNIQKLIGAGQGGPTMGSAIAQNVQQTGQSAQQAYEKEGSQFKSAADQAAEELKQGRQTVLGQGGLVETAGAGKIDPKDIGKAIEQYNTATKSYQGPMGLEGQGQAAAARATAMGRAGTSELVQGQYGRMAGYNPALRRFDVAMVGRDPNLQDIRQQQAQVSGAGEKYQRLAGYAAGRGQQLGAETQGFRTEAGQKLGETQTGLEKIIGEKLTTTQKEMGSATEALKKNIQEGNVSEADMQTLKSMGLDPNMLTGVATKQDIINAITSREGDIARQNVISQEQANALRALQALQGKGYEAKDIGITDESQIGKMGPIGKVNTGTLGTINASTAEAKEIEKGFLGQLGAKQKEYQQQEAKVGEATKAASDTAKSYGLDLANINKDFFSPIQDTLTGRQYSKAEEYLTQKLMADPEFRNNMSKQHPELFTGEDPTKTSVATDIAKGLSTLLANQIGTKEYLSDYSKAYANQYRDIYRQGKEALSPYTSGASYQNLATLLGYKGAYTPTQYFSGYGEAGPSTETVQRF